MDLTKNIYEREKKKIHEILKADSGDIVLATVQPGGETRYCLCPELYITERVPRHF
jgi:hypothetical protein